MQAITYANAHSKLADTMTRVCEDHEPVTIASKTDRAVVMLSLEDHNALIETAHLLRSGGNARRSLDAIAELEQGGGSERELVE